MQNPNEVKSEEENFIKIRCYSCGKVLFEAAADTTGAIRKKCENNRCRELRTISLPLEVKNANLQTIRA